MRPPTPRKISASFGPSCAAAFSVAGAGGVIEYSTRLLVRLITEICPFAQRATSRVPSDTIIMS
jgi:hypothetical protein